MKYKWYSKKALQAPNPADAGRKLNVYKTFRRRAGRLLNVLCKFNLRPVSAGNIPMHLRKNETKKKTKKKQRCVSILHIP